MVRIIKIGKNEAKKRLGDVPDDKRFWCHDGKIFKNLRELQKAFHDMSDETFHYHSGEQRRDFSKWVGEVVGDEELANDLTKAKSRIQAGQAVAERISFLGNKV